MKEQEENLKKSKIFDDRESKWKFQKLKSLKQIDVNNKNKKIFTMENINLKFEAVIIKEDDIFCSLCIDLNVASEGETIEEAKKNLIEAVNDYIEIAIENNLPIMRKVSDVDNPIFTIPEEVIEKFNIKTDQKEETYV